MTFGDLRDDSRAATEVTYGIVGGVALCNTKLLWSLYSIEMGDIPQETGCPRVVRTAATMLRRRRVVHYRAAKNRVPSASLATFNVADGGKSRFWKGMTLGHWIRRSHRRRSTRPFASKVSSRPDEALFACLNKLKRLEAGRSPQPHLTVRSWQQVRNARRNWQAPCIGSVA